MGDICMKYVVSSQFSSFLTPTWGNGKTGEKKDVKQQRGNLGPVMLIL